MKMQDNSWGRRSPLLRVAASSNPALVFPDTRKAYDEARYVALCYLDRRLHVLCFTARAIPLPKTPVHERVRSNRVTLALSKKSIEFFKSEATKHHTQYQRMIRRLLDAYVDGQAPTRKSPRPLRDKAAQRR